MVEGANLVRGGAEFGEWGAHKFHLPRAENAFGKAAKFMGPLGMVAGGMKIAHADDPGDVLAGAAEIGSGAIGTLGAVGAVTGAPGIIGAAHALGPAGALMGAFGLGHTIGTALDGWLGLSDKWAGVTPEGLDNYYRQVGGVENQRVRGVGGIAEAEAAQKRNNPIAYYTEQARREMVKLRRAEAQKHFAE